MVDEFARLVLPFGTTAVVADPHEIANVLGVDGVHWLLDATSGLQLDVYFMAPSCVPASPFESPRRALTPGDLESLMRRRRVLGLAEMMNFPGVVGAPRAREVALDGARHVDGHAPPARAHQMQAAGIYPITRPHPRGGCERSERMSSCARRPRGIRGAAATGDGGPAHRLARTIATWRTSPPHVNGMVARPSGCLAGGCRHGLHHPALWHGRRHGDRAGLRRRSAASPTS
jgi:hypothetical protein